MRFGTVYIIFLAASAAAQLFPPPGGPFHVTWENSELVDNSRADPFNASHPRRLMISRFTPVPKSTCEKLCRVPYMTPEMAGLEEEIYKAAFPDLEWLNGIFRSLEVQVCCKQDRTPKKKFPTILFGPGHNTTRTLYTGTAQQIASMGYEIVVIDHPYETDIVQFPNGDIIFGGRVGSNPEDKEDIVLGLDIRAQDVTFILDTLNLNKTVYMGHSYGGASAAHTLPKDLRLVSGVNLDGAMWSDVQYTGVDRPFLCVGSIGHNSSSIEEPTWQNFFHAMDTIHPSMWKRELTINGSVHGSYYDFPIIGDVTGFREGAEAFFGVVTGEVVIKVLREYLSDFIQFTLLGGEEGLLSGPDDDFPEVIFLR